MLPFKPDFSGTTYVPTSSSTRRVKSCIRGTCKAWTEQLFIISMIRAHTDFHTYVLGVLFKAWNVFLSYLFILFLFSFFWIFERLKLYFFKATRWKDRLDDLPGYNGTSPQAWMKLSRSAILTDLFFVCNAELKECICENLNMPWCERENYARI